MTKHRDAIIGRAVTDADFRKRLLADPAATLEAEGYEADPELVESIRAVDPAAAESALAALGVSADRKAAT